MMRRFILEQQHHDGVLGTYLLLVMASSRREIPLAI